MEISREVFDQQRRPRFGNANPERMHLAFWEWMIRGPASEVIEEHGGTYAAQFGLMREGKLKSVFGPWRVRDLFKIPLNRDEGPIWTFDRMGRTCTELPNGRTVCIGGEHEDYYDPDFCIYNDVVVIYPEGEIDICGYPKEVFPPTDFHTATLIGGQIILIGGLGYPEDRRPGHTPVYALDLSDYHISEIETSGEMPGWIWKQEADFDSAGRITIRGGEVFEDRESDHRFRRNLEDYSLDIRSGLWEQITNRNWRQFSIRRGDRKWFDESPKPESLLPGNIEHTVVPCEDDWRSALIVVKEVPISFTVEMDAVQVVVQGDLSSELLLRIIEGVRSNAEAAIQAPCVQEQW